MTARRLRLDPGAQIFDATGIPNSQGKVRREGTKNFIEVHVMAAVARKANGVSGVFDAGLGDRGERNHHARRGASSDWRQRHHNADERRAGAA